MKKVKKIKGYQNSSPLKKALSSLTRPPSGNVQAEIEQNRELINRIYEQKNSVEVKNDKQRQLLRKDEGNVKKVKKLKRITIRELMTEFFDEMDHFIDQGGWPCHASTYTKERLSQLGWLYVNDEGLLARNKEKPIQKEILAAYWKVRFDELNEDLLKIYTQIDKLKSLT